MCLMLKILVYLYLYTGVLCAHQIPWLPCRFTDEHVFVNEEGHTETQHIHRDAMLQFGQTGDAPVNPDAITFLLTGSKLDLRRYVEAVNADQLECEIRRYSTEGLFIRWPVQAPQDYNHWFSCTLRHSEGLFTVTAFLRHPSDQHPPGEQDYRSWPAIADRETLTTTVAMVIKTQSPAVKAGLGSQMKLHCQFGIDHRGPNVTVEWHWQQRGERKKLFGHTSRSGKTEGTGVGLKALAGGDASYTLPFTKMSSEGTYICSVAVNPLFVSLDINLHVEEPPRVSLNVGPTLSLQEGEEQKVVCEAQGYYPLDVEFVWSKQDPAASGQRVGAPLPENLENILLSSHKHNRDKTYTVLAFFYLQASLRDSGRQFTCSVSHQSLRMPIRKSFILNIEDPVSWMFYLTGGFTVVALLAFLFVMLRYLYSARQRSVRRKPY
ncbi:tapasin-like [Embiotoca jacksoni]|uniref:tapasin-like n=1 Tax=Embiotoca jacksoni TaxID=100190 RepID=UPI0037043853